MKRKKTKELILKGEKELLQEFERIYRELDAAISPAPTAEFEKIVAEMKKRNIVPQVREELRTKFGKKNRFLI